MTGTDLCVNKCKQSWSYLNHLVILLDERNLSKMCAIYSLIHMLQEWWFTNDNRIKHHDVCLSLSAQQIGAPLLMRFCDSSENQVCTASLTCFFLYDIYMKIKKCICATYALQLIQVV